VDLRKAVEEPGRLLRAHPHPAVLDAEDDPVARLAGFAGGVQGDRATLGELAGVGQQIHQDPPDLRLVGDHRAQPGPGTELDGVALPLGDRADPFHPRSDHRLDLEPDRIEVDTLVVHGLAQVQQVVDQLEEVLAPVDDQLEVGDEGVLPLLLRPAEEVLAEADDDGERGPEVVSHVAQEDLLLLHGLFGGLLGGHQLLVLLGELGGPEPDALLQLVGVPAPEGVELRLGELPLGHVPRVDHDPADGRVVEQVGPGRLQGPPSAGLVAEPVLDGPVSGLARDQAAHPVGHGLEVVGVDHVEAGEPDEVLRLVAEDPTDRGALVANGPVALEDRDQVGTVLDQRTEVPLASDEVIAGLAELILPGGDLGHHPPEPPGELAELVATRGDLDEAVGPVVAGLDRLGGRRQSGERAGDQPGQVRDDRHHEHQATGPQACRLHGHPSGRGVEHVLRDAQDDLPVRRPGGLPEEEASPTGPVELRPAFRALPVPDQLAPFRPTQHGRLPLVLRGPAAGLGDHETFRAQEVGDHPARHVPRTPSFLRDDRTDERVEGATIHVGPRHSDEVSFPILDRLSHADDQDVGGALVEIRLRIIRGYLCPSGPVEVILGPICLGTPVPLGPGRLVDVVIVIQDRRRVGTPVHPLKSLGSEDRVDPVEGDVEAVAFRGRGGVERLPEYPRSVGVGDSLMAQRALTGRDASGEEGDLVEEGVEGLGIGRHVRSEVLQLLAADLAGDGHVAEDQGDRQDQAGGRDDERAQLLTECPRSDGPDSHGGDSSKERERTRAHPTRTPLRRRPAAFSGIVAGPGCNGDLIAFDASIEARRSQALPPDRSRLDLLRSRGRSRTLDLARSRGMPS
jgi:hypothetical protein